MKRASSLLASFLTLLLVLVWLGVLFGGTSSREAETSLTKVAKALETTLVSSLNTDKTVVDAAATDAGCAVIETQSEPSIIPEPPRAVVSAFDSMSREALIGMQAVLNDRFLREKNMALYFQWVGGVLHDVPRQAGPSGRLGHLLEDTENPIIRQYRMHHDGVTSRCEEVRLDPEAYPEIYQIRDDLNHIKAALRVHGYDPVLSSMFPAIGSEFKRTVFGAD